MPDIKIGIIGGSGVYQLDAVKVKEEKEIDTPFGSPSDKIAIADVHGREAAFIPRHGKGHHISPTEVPSQANIWALKSLGVEKIISVSAVGSLKEEIRPTDFVLPNQIIDRTRHRKDSYFGNGIVGHIGFADPFCEDMREEIASIIQGYFEEHCPGKRLFTEESYICIEGPQFSTRAESNLYRSWGAGVIGMTAIPEAKLAREAEICFTTIALSTDYDCWKEDEEAVGVNMVLEYMKENNKTVNGVLPLIIEKLSSERNCSCETAAQYAVMTSPDHFPSETKEKLKLFYGKYW